MNAKNRGLQQTLTKYKSQLIVHLNTRPYAGIDNDLVSFLERRIKDIKVELQGGTKQQIAHSGFRKVG